MRDVIGIVSTSTFIGTDVCPAAQQNTDDKSPRISAAAASNIISLPHQL